MKKFVRFEKVLNKFKPTDWPYGKLRRMELGIRQPNPAKESVAVQYTLNSTASIALFDVTGRQLAEHQTTTTSGEWNLNTESFPEGIYLVVVKQTNGHVEQHKLVIE